jgi:hypothetical protein
VLPGVIVFGLGLTLVATPVTATVLAATDQRHAGIASGINNAVARVANLLSVAALPLVAELGGKRFYQPAAMTQGLPRRHGSRRRPLGGGCNRRLAPWGSRRGRRSVVDR